MSLSSQRFDRKVFLTWALGSTSAVALGCSDAATEPPPATGGVGGSGVGGSGGSSAFPMAGSGGSGGSFGTAGSTSAGTGGAAGGTGGAAAGSGGAPMANCTTQMKVFISANHGHALNVSVEDVMAGVPKVYDTKGTSMHEHWIQLTAADFGKLKAGMSVRKLSCNDGHEHEYIVNCVGNDKPDTTSGAPGFCDTDHKCAGAMDMFCPELP